MNELRKRGFFYATLILFTTSLAIHYYTSYIAYTEQERQHEGQTFTFQGFITEFTRQVMENWQSEFLQLMWQVGGLSFLLWVGSSQSKHEDQRLQEEVNYIISKVTDNPKEAERFINEMKERYPDK